MRENRFKWLADVLKRKLKELAEAVKVVNKVKLEAREEVLN